MRIAQIKINFNTNYSKLIFFCQLLESNSINIPLKRENIN